MISKNEYRIFISMEENEEIEETLKSCISRAGIFISSGENNILGKIKYGLAKLDVRISWEQKNNGYFVAVQVFGGDIWGRAKNRRKEDLEELIMNRNNTGFIFDRLGFTKSQIFATFYLFIIAMLITLYVTKNLGLFTFIGKFLPF